MKEKKNIAKILLLQMSFYVLLVLLISLTIRQFSKVTLPKISDRDLIFWLLEDRYF